MFGCNEDLTGGACPVLCPEQNLTLIDTVLDAVAVDTTISGLPPLGSETLLLLLRRQDSLQTAAVLRFDTLTRSFVRSSTDTTHLPVVDVDSARLVLFVDGTISGKAPIVFDVYEVDTGPLGNDTASVNATLRSGAMPLASLTVPADTAVTELDVPLPNAAVAAHVTGNSPLVLAITARSDSAVAIRFGSREGLNPAQLRYTAIVSPTDHRGALVQVSDTAQGPFVQGELADFTTVVRGTPPPPPGVVEVGGLPATRAYYRFEIPRRILDSTTVVRASLQLTQRPVAGVGAEEPTVVLAQAVGVGSAIEPGHAVLLPRAVPAVRPDTLLPTDSGQVRIEIVSVLRTWAGTDTTKLQHAIILTSGGEFLTPQRLQFFSLEADSSLRPRLRVTFVPSANFGLP